MSERCATMPLHHQLLASSPEYVAARAAIEQQTFDLRLAAMARRAEIVTIPIVVHVVWNTDADNITREQIDSQLAALNADFRQKNPDVTVVPEVWTPLVADCRVEFRLADTDPNGKPTDGVVRVRTTTTGFGADDTVKKASVAWPADRYLNIWVCTLSGGLLGYATFPGSPADRDGVVILNTAFGTVGTAAAPFNKGRTLTHEIGHWLNLRHIWGDDGDACNGSDFVDDTPNQAGPNKGTPTFPQVSCSNGPHGDMFVNYMDYTADAGMVMFTEGQATRIADCLSGPRSSFAAVSRPASSGRVG